ncbi:Plasma alpha-L-fucosidase, partial [Armadillidium nasatum]
MLFFFLFKVHSSQTLSYSRRGIFLEFLTGYPETLAQFEPNWDSLDSRELPKWYDEAKIGIFLHWGVFSVPSFKSAWFWKSWKDGSEDIVDFMKKNYPPGFTYQDFGPSFTAEFFNPYEWADIFNASGARYIVLTSKHHEGFTLWPSKYSWNWNSMDVGPGRDLVGDLSKEIRTAFPHIKFGLYHSLYEWFNPLYLQDEKNGYNSNDFVRLKTMPELYELSPVRKSVVVNDRWGKGITCHHGSFYTCQDKFNPGVLQPHKWENCMTLDKYSWVYNRLSPLQNYLTIEELLNTLVKTISCGGNLLVNTGPTHDGRIAPIMEERLRQMGSWLSINGEAVYGSKPWVYQNDTYTPDIWFTRSTGAESFVYAFISTWPENSYLILGSVKKTTKSVVQMLGCTQVLQTEKSREGLKIWFPRKNNVKSNWNFVLKMKYVKPRIPKF